MGYFLLRARTGALNPETSLWHASPRSQPWQRWRSSRWRWSLTRASCCKEDAAVVTATATATTTASLSTTATAMATPTATSVMTVATTVTTMATATRTPRTTTATAMATQTSLAQAGCVVGGGGREGSG